MGLTKLITALPIGWVADKCGRHRAAKTGSLAYSVASTVTVFAMLMADRHSNQKLWSFWVMLTAMCLWGLGRGVVDGPVQALYADSVPTGLRSKYFMYLFLCFWTGGLLGPAVTIVIFVSQSNGWTTFELSLCIFIAVGLKMVNAVLLLFLRDSNALGREADHATVETPQVPEKAAEEGRRLSRSCSEPSYLIPLCVILASLVSQSGAGMTVKFFPLFFKNDCGMSPAGVQGVYLAVPVMMMTAGTLSGMLGRKIGRVQTVLLFKGLSVLFLFLLVYLRAFRHRWYVVVPIFLLQTCFGGSTYPLEESIIMDYTPRGTRGRWKSLESVATFGWCGSAALGGWLVDRFNYSFTFSITASIQAVSLLFWARLLPLVITRESDLAVQPTEDTTPAFTGSEQQTTTESPLLDET